MFEYSLYYFAFTVLIYGFLGWCGEVIFAALCHGKFVNRGFLGGPICPIYGFGMLIVLAVLTPVEGNLAVLFFGSVVLASLLELVTGLVLDKIFSQKWWDYSEFPLNIGGYVCPLFSLLWGVGCVLMVRVVHPLIHHLIVVIPHTAGIVVLAILYAAFLADFIFTAIGLAGLSRELRAVSEVERLLKRASDEIGEKLADGTIDVMEKSAPMREQGEEALQKYKELSAKRRSATVGRLMKAFPNLDGAPKLKDSYERLKSKLHRDRD